MRWNVQSCGHALRLPSTVTADAYLAKYGGDDFREAADCNEYGYSAQTQDDITIDKPTATIAKRPLRIKRSSGLR